MKKIITIISMFLCLFLFSKTQVFAFENENLVITDEKITINYLNNEIVLKSSEKKAYELCDNYNNRICTHIIYNKNIQVDIILYNNIEFNRFYAEILIENEDESNNYANLNEISKNDYTSLIDNAVQINYESAIGIVLRTKQTTFEKLYYGKNNDINSYNSDEKTNIENMTNSSSYIDSYYPTPFSETGYTRVYDDNIINIVPKTWFYTVRSDCYIGKEYGIYKNTTVTYNYAFSVKCYKTNVVIWKFDSFVPCMYGNKTDELFAESEKYKLKIYEKFNYNYCAFMRTDVGETIWNKYFDTREDQIVAQSIDSYDKVYLVPKYSSYGIDNFNNLEDNAFKIRNFSYRLVADADISISDQKLVLGLGKTIFGLAELLENSYLEKTLLILMNCYYVIFSKIIT